MAEASAGPYAKSASCTRQISTPTPHHSMFAGWMLAEAQPTVSEPGVSIHK